MKNTLNRVLAATIIFSATTFTGCKKDNSSSSQWEYAARGGQKSKGYKYAGSNTLDEVAWYADLAELPADQGIDYAGPVTGEKIAGCGGCYSSEPYTCTYSYHGREKDHNGRDATLGFRIVLRVSKP